MGSYVCPKCNGYKSLWSNECTKCFTSHPKPIILCKYCGKKITPHHIKCVKCAAKVRIYPKDIGLKTANAWMRKKQEAIKKYGIPVLIRPNTWKYSRSEAYKLLQQGLSYKKVANMLGVGASHFYYAMKQYKDILNASTDKDVIRMLLKK